jgi:ABC-type lipoprotein release transport system permease subunit
VAGLSTRLLQALLFEVSPTDPQVLGLVTAVLVSAAAAALGPALRAARTDSTMALRAE